MLEYFFGPLAVACIVGWAVASFRYPKEADRALKPLGTIVAIAFFGYLLFGAGYTQGYQDGASLEAAKAYFAEFRWQSNLTMAMWAMIGGMALVYGPFLARSLILGWDYPNQKGVDRQPKQKDATE